MFAKKLLFISSFGSHISLVAPIELRYFPLGSTLCSFFTIFLDKLLLYSLLFFSPAELTYFFSYYHRQFFFLFLQFLFYFYTKRRKNGIIFVCRCGKREPRFFITRAISTSHPLGTRLTKRNRNFSHIQRSSVVWAQWRDMRSLTSR